MLKQWIYLALGSALLLPGSFVFADTPARPMSYKQESPGGKYVFVMIAPMSIEEDAGNWNEEEAAKQNPDGQEARVKVSDSEHRTVADAPGTLASRINWPRLRRQNSLHLKSREICSTTTYT